jgi:hypothetical protein
MIVPNYESIRENKGGSKYCIIGKPGSGKTTLTEDIIYSKLDLIPVAEVISGSEDSNSFYSQFFPKLFVHEKYDKETIEKFIQRQKLAISNFKTPTTPWALLIMDDCMDNTKIFSDPLLIGLFKNSRHWKMMSLFICQYVLDFKPVIRSSLDGVFIFREPNVSNREKLWKNFASIIPTFSLFCKIMDDITVDHTCLYIDNFTTTNNWQDCVYYYKATRRPPFKFGCLDYRIFAEQREDKDLD